MQKEKHPKLELIMVESADGTKWQVRTAKPIKKGSVLKMRIDPTNHNAWTKKRNISIGNMMDRFKNKYGDIDI